MGRVPIADRETRNGTFPNGMDYLSLGNGGKKLLFIQGGPGSTVPRGLLRQMLRRQFAPLFRAGYSVWIVTRRRGMPPEHRVADMADDYARLIAEEFGGRVDIVVAESFGGMIAQYLAARHPESFDHMAMVVTAAELSDWGKDVDSRMAHAIADGDPDGAGTVFAEYLIPNERLRWLRRLLGPVISRLVITGAGYPLADVLTEVEAEVSFDSRAVLPHIRRPVLLLCGGSDQFFPQDVARETAGLIPDCTLIWYEGMGHLRAASSRRIARDVLAYVGPG
ncbi:alpha/beta fold hydrolase [Pseudarthrobacter sp. PH31-O2]|uniref:alpha/beta fold hydrolase n=1 Tax=Pseudarthrobacter sp. PH31-O2 TaxID=3046206 RepID=UPI0024B90FB4|nr:alpha/beta fold hydrolase [Pseudarthrobacter sp. PH31-O2]MDJ0351585.1 alpha/beta fold hydrolase [Pseudarthrobacter sp. PH31-O2]